MNEFVKLSPKCGDWEAWYLNGKLIAEGHSVRAGDLLDALADIFPNTVKSIEIPDEKAEEGFEKNLEDMISNKQKCIHEWTYLNEGGIFSQVKECKLCGERDIEFD